MNWVITIHNYPQPPKKPSTTTQKHPQRSATNHNHPKTTQKLPKKPKICHIHLFYCTLDVNIETDVDFHSDMKQWYIYGVFVCVCVCVCLCACVPVCLCACVPVCIYFIRHYIYYFFIRLIVCFCQYSK